MTTIVKHEDVRILSSRQAQGQELKW